MRSFAVLTALCGVASAHFKMLYPDSIGWEDEKEDTAPCGGFTPDFTKNVVDFHAGGDSLGMSLFHSQSNWLFRVTLDQKAESGWEQIFPIVQQSGLGFFCEQGITVPEKYIGQKGVIGIVSAASDGLLFQCIAANFVKGSVPTPSACKNSSGVTGAFKDDPTLSALVGPSSVNSTTPSKTDASASGVSKTAAPSHSKSADAASALQAWSTTGFSMGGAITLVSMVLAGGALMI